MRGAPPQSLLSSSQRGGGPCCCSYVYKLVSDTLTVRKTPSEGDARRGREGEGEGEEGEGGEKSVGAFSERDGRRERGYSTVQRGERERETSQQSARWRGSKKGKGRLPPLRCHGSRSEKERREGWRYVFVCCIDAENLISIIVAVTVAAPRPTPSPSRPVVNCRKADAPQEMRE